MPGMQIIRDPAEMQVISASHRRAGKRVALVPTMGFLHEGHASLMREASRRAEVVIASIFVNPTQFGPNEDFDRYPRDFARDERICREAGVASIFHPSAEAMYFPDASIHVVEESLGRFLCGGSRPGHFQGVCTVVAKLLNIVSPEVAVFGAKDAQQVRIIRRMVRDLNFPVEIVESPTVREADGLAISSRNSRLTESERSQAVCLRRALSRVEDLYRQGERNTEALIREMKRIIAQSPNARLDYAQIVDDETLAPVLLIERPALAAIAVNFSNARLIDNSVLA